MKSKRSNSAVYLFTIVFVCVNVLLHKNDGPLSPLRKHTHGVHFSLNSHYLNSDLPKSLSSKEQEPQIAKKKLRVRYKGSEVKLVLPVAAIKVIATVPVIKAYTLPDCLFIPLSLQFIASLRGPPVA